LILTAANAAAAEITYVNAFAKYHSVDVDSVGTEDLKTFGSAIEVRSNAWTFSGELGRFSGELADLDFTTLGAGYLMPNGVTLGLDYARFELAGFDADVTSGYAMYDIGTFILGVSVGDLCDPNDPVYSVFGAWDVMQTSRVGFDFIRIEEENLFAGDVDYDLSHYNVQVNLISIDGFDLISLSGGYDLGYGFEVIGYASKFDLACLDGNSLTLGAPYNLAPGTSAEVALGRINVDGTYDIYLMTFGLQYVGRLPTSSATRRVPFLVSPISDFLPRF
jgi:hypothetical protein